MVKPQSKLDFVRAFRRVLMRIEQTQTFGEVLQRVITAMSLFG